MEVAQREEDAFKLLILGAHLERILRGKTRYGWLALRTLYRGKGLDSRYPHGWLQNDQLFVQDKWTPFGFAEK